MKIVTAAEMRDIDRATSERFGVPSLTLMENAGSAVAEHVHARYASCAQKIVGFLRQGQQRRRRIRGSARVAREGQERCR